MLKVKYQEHHFRNDTPGLFSFAIGAEPVKQQTPNVNDKTQSVEQNIKQQEKPAQSSSSVENDDQNKVVQKPNTGSGSQDGDPQQQAAEIKDQKVPNSESSKSDDTEEESLSDSVESSAKQKKPDISVAKIQVGGDAGLGIEESAIEETMESNKFSNQTAVIVLAMGLGITAILLIFVGCRLRNVKRRLRKGRPMNSNEADYLINGMYL